jgi:glycosyltransferase involved in cell wall biosynthesis
MKVMMLTWEFPPRIIGGIAPHVYDLSRALGRQGVTVIVVTCDFPGAPEREMLDGIEVHRVNSYQSPTPDFASWTYLMNMNLKRYAAELLYLDHRVDVIHAHDWLVAEAAVGLKHLFRIPLLATIHSTEYGRRNGVHTDYQRMIHQTEVWLSREAWRAICCSDYMASHVNFALGLPRENISVIPNGVDLEKFSPSYDREAFRRDYASPDEKIVLFVGRMVYEKGVGLLLEAAHKVLRSVKAKFIFVGEGYLRDVLAKKAMDEGIARRVYFTGFLNDPTVKLLYRTADVCVVPSLYEPFGIVAIEAMAAGTPVVVSDVGGLSEIVQHDVTGVVVYPNNTDSLAWGILRVLEDRQYANVLSRRAWQRVIKTYNWDAIACETSQVYHRLLKEYSCGSWNRPSQLS